MNNMSFILVLSLAFIFNAFQVYGEDLLPGNGDHFWTEGIYEGSHEYYGFIKELMIEGNTWKPYHEESHEEIHAEYFEMEELIEEDNSEIYEEREENKEIWWWVF